MYIIMLTILLYLLDVIVFGSIIGLFLISAYSLESFFTGNSHNLTEIYFASIAWYIIIDSFISKIKIHYNDALEFIRKR